MMTNSRSLHYHVLIYVNKFGWKETYEGHGYGRLKDALTTKKIMIFKLLGFLKEKDLQSEICNNHDRV